MEALLQFIDAYGLWFVFVCVLLDQGGLPTPAYPPIILTSALAVEGERSLLSILLIAILAAVLADVVWYICGRRFGATMLRLICTISLSPDSCVGTTRRVYSRWGAPSLIFAKYVPGLAAVATTLAGETRIGVVRFLLYDALGAALWAGSAVALGAIFHDAVGAVLLTLEQLGSYAIAAARTRHRPVHSLQVAPTSSVPHADPHGAPHSDRTGGTHADAPGPCNPGCALG